MITRVKTKDIKSMRKDTAYEKARQREEARWKREEARWKREIRFVPLAFEISGAEMAEVFKECVHGVREALAAAATLYASPSSGASDGLMAVAAAAARERGPVSDSH
jgi:hypothetical protein